MSFGTTLERGRPFGSKDKNPQIRKWANMKYDPSEDMKRVFDIIDFLVPEELIKYLKVMKIKRSRRIMSWMEIMSWIKYDGIERKSALTIFLYNIALYVIRDNEDHELKFFENYRQDIECLNEMMQLLRN